MSAYRGRTGPNFSQYLNDLNAISPPEYPFASGEENEFSNDLAMYTNTDFTNLDVPGLPEDGAFNFDLSPDTEVQDNLKFEELLSASGPTTEFDTTGTVSDVVAPPRPQSFFTSYNTPIQPAPTSAFPPTEPVQRITGHVDATHSRLPSISPSDHASAEEKSRLAAEEDKRRRNTAASARFRVKKKQREQALEKTLKETQEKNSKLDAKITQLELENQWLKDLITEKNGLSSREEIAAAFEKHRKESEERDLKTEPAHTTGVGTA